MDTSTKTAGLAIKNNRKIKVFLFFLVLTTIIWLLIELSKSYTSTALLKLEYTNLPSDKILQNKPVSEIEIALKAPGFTLLRYKIKKQKVFINLNNVLKNNASYYILPNKQLAHLNSQLAGEIELARVLNDTIFIELGINKFKKVPIVSNLKLNFKLGYNLTEKLKLSPDSILISGPEKYIDSINEVTTVNHKLSEVYKNISLELALIEPPEYNHVMFSNTTIKIKGEVDKFTEGSVTIPVNIINVPDGIKIDPFPKEIEVTYRAGLSNFNKINKNSFSVIFDYKQYENDTLIQYLTPIVRQKSEYISSLKLNPSQIEFLIQK